MLVWAKMRFCVYWPAQVVETPPELGPTPRNKVCVLFLGTKQFGFVLKDKIENYIENRERFVKKGKGIDFRRAVQQMDEYISNKKKFSSHVCVAPMKIRIKTERDIEQQLGIKVESSNEYESNDKNAASSTATSPAWAKEKKSLIDNIMALKSENQLLVQNLDDTKSQLVSTNVLNHDLDRRLTEENLKFAAKTNELNRALQNATEKEAEMLQSVTVLKRENSLLMSQNKQLQTGLAQSQEAGSDSDESEVYEVENILDDKMERRYLVRWKGYDSTHDTWERESNLNCSHILKQCKKSMKKH